MKIQNLIKYSILLLLFFGIEYISKAQSDDCSGAVALTPAATCVTTNYNVASTFTASATTASCVPNVNIARDGWFSFNATATTSIIRATTDRNLILAVYTGTCAGTLTEVGCANAGAGGVTESLTLPTLIGTTYFIRLIRRYDGTPPLPNNNMTGNVCVRVPVLANDECTGAFTLPVGQFECTFGGITNVGGTYSNTFGGDPSCANGIGAEDVWYKFVAPAGGQAVIDTEAGSITDSGMELYRSTDGTCNTLTSVDCDDDGANGAMSRILDYTLVGGNTYYLRVWDYGGGTGTMNICVQNQYSDCEVSFPLCSSSSFNTNSFGPGATDSNIGNCFTTGLDPTETQSIWLNFEIQTTGTLGLILDSQNPAGDDYDFNLFRANTCAGITAANSVSCNARSSTGAGGTTGISTANGGATNSEGPGVGNPFNLDLSVIAGERYYIIINNYSTTGIGFDIAFSGTSSLDCVVLPLELMEFGGEKVKDQNLLHWTTIRELGTSNFEVERSNDAMDFTKIGTLKSGNKNMETQIYQYWDKEPQTGINYYRLKQVDLDGTFTYSPTIAINNQGIITNFELQKIYPNPAQNEINFVFAVPNQSELQLEIFDSNGQSISKSSQNYPKGIQTFTQNLSSFSKGLYILRILNLKTGQVLIEKFIKN